MTARRGSGSARRSSSDSSIAAASSVASRSSRLRSSPRARLRARPAYHQATSASTMRATVTPAAAQENPAWAASESLLVARKRPAGIGPLHHVAAVDRVVAREPPHRQRRNPEEDQQDQQPLERAAPLKTLLAPRAGGAGRGGRRASTAELAIVSRYSVKRMSMSACFGARVPPSPAGIDPREAIATTTSATRTPSAVSRALRPRELTSIAG